MKIYLLDRDAENYRWMEYKGNWFEFFLKLLDSEPLGKFEEKIEWKTIKEKKEIGMSDYPCFSVPAISQKAYNVLSNSFLNLVEIFPFAFNKKYGQYYFMNIINLLDCLDVEKSELKFSSDGKRIMRIKRYVFQEKILDMNTTIFKLKNKRRGEVFVNEETKLLIENAGLEGFIFTQVWDSEDPDFVYEPKKIF